MCGIFGSVGQPDNIATVYQGLRDLSYRGYDSFGYGFVDELSLTPIVHKYVGRIGKEFTAGKEFSPKAVIGHTRWATHGESTIKNAHPHIGDLHKESACLVVHNGQINHHEEIRQRLIKLGYKFQSDSDSECLAHWLNHTASLQDSKVEAIKDVVQGIDGDVTILCIFADCPDEIYGYSNTGQLFMTPNGYFSSDRASLYGLSDKCHQVKKEVISINKRHYTSVEEFELPLNGYALEDVGCNSQLPQSLMLKEINSQRELKVPNIKNPEHLQYDRYVLYGCGSSYNAAMLGKYYIDNLADYPCESIHSSELMNYKTIPDCTLYVALSQSGETKDTIDATKAIKEKYAAKSGSTRIACVTNNVNSLLPSLCDYVIDIDCGTERAVAATKSFTAQALTLLRLANSQLDLQPLCDNIGKVIDQGIPARIIDTLAKASYIIILGEAYQYPIALEGALKIKEVAEIPAEGMCSAEVKHGPIALVNDNNAFIFLLTKSCSNEKHRQIYNNIQQVKARGGKCVFISEEDIDEDNVILIPTSWAYYSPLVINVVLQLIAYKLALSKGLDPDYPKNLAKAISV